MELWSLKVPPHLRNADRGAGASVTRPVPFLSPRQVVRSDLEEEACVWGQGAAAWAPRTECNSRCLVRNGTVWSQGCAREGTSTACSPCHALEGGTQAMGATTAGVSGGSSLISGGRR